VFSRLELSDASLLTIRLARNGLLQPSAVQHVVVVPTSAADVSQCSIDSLSRVHRHVIHSCIHNTFPQLMFAYLQFWRYGHFCNSNDNNNHWAVELVHEIGRRATLVTGKPRESTFPFQQLSIALHRGNMVAFLNTFDSD